jgi:hypothetical protein
MKTNEISCYFESDDTFGPSKAHVNIAYIESLNSLYVGVDIMAGDERHTVYFPHAVIPLIVQGLSCSYFSIQESINQMEADDGK